MKKAVCILLTLCITVGGCACGKSSGGYGVGVVQVLDEQEYSIGFRTGDTVYFYVTGALKVLAASGKVSELSHKWLGSDAVEFDKDANALSELAQTEPRELFIGVDINSFPMAYISNNDYWGFDVELALAVCELLGWTLKIQPIEKENVYIELSSGNIDCAWGGIVLDDAEVEAGKYVRFGPYVHNDVVIAARKGSSVWGKTSLRGRSMAMCATDEAMAALHKDESLLNKLGQITRLAGGTTECFQYLYAGKCDAILTDSTAVDYFNCH